MSAVPKKRVRKWRCPNCEWYTVIQITLMDKPVNAYACGNCTRMIPTDMIHNLPSRRTQILV